MNLSTSLAEVKGVGPRILATLETAGLETVGQLVEFLPRQYEDFSKVTVISEIRPGKVTVKARVASVTVKQLGWRSSMVTAVLDDGTGRINAVWFNQPYRARQFGREEFYFSGVYEMKYGRFQMTNPSAEKVKEMPVQTGRVLPVYPVRKGLKPNVTRKVLDELRPFMTMLPDFLPEELVRKFELLPYAEALLAIHFPASLGDFEKGRERLAFNEVFELVLAARLNRRENERLAGFAMAFDEGRIRELVGALPFRMTGAQRRAAWEILRDLGRTIPMNRLLQGDVGAGKTVVAGVAAYQAHIAGYQTALAAPTGVLAGQHFRTLSDLLGGFGVRVGLLVGGGGKGKREVLAGLASGEIDVVVGTHALFEEAVSFRSLGLVVVDEQHRFGVRQRNKLLAKVGGEMVNASEKGLTSPRLEQRMPHLLSMTATPIPRSLQLTLFGDLGISVLDELPQNRLAIKTKIWRNSRRDEFYDFVKGELAAGRQAYFVTPSIEESTMDTTLKSVEAVYKEVCRIFSKWRVGILHGRMKASEKERVMGEFKEGKLDILVSTTVIEVGVDVPNATVMAIENAERFGLAQLHQLRGRVGRGEWQSYCFLLPTDIERVPRRLRYIEQSTDGFFLAEKDLEMRGPGEIYGAAQHGELDLQVANIADTKLISLVARAADWFMDNFEVGEFSELERRVRKSQKITTLN